MSVIEKEVVGAVLALALTSGALLVAADCDESSSWSAVESGLLELFPPAVVEVSQVKQGETTISSTYTPSGSLWTPGLDERNVFDLLIRHEQDEDNSFDLRLGKGGQIYSLRSSFGESVNPQKFEAHWNDGVWQPVCHPTTTKYHPISRLPEEMANPIKESEYAHGQFVHGAGTYRLQGMDSGVFTVSCDVMLDRDKPGKLDIILRDAQHGRPMLTFGTLHMTERQISLGGERVADARPGEWLHVALSFALSGDATGIITAEVRNAEGESSAAAAPFTATDVRTFTWLGLSAAGGTEGIIYVDNLEVKREVDGQTEWPLRYDFEQESERSLDLDKLVVGTDEAKGGVVKVTDRVAASGKRSLEIRDAAGLDAGWQPLVRTFLHTTLGEALYSPKLASDITGNGRISRTVNWGLVPQLKTISRSPILYYTQVRDVGDGIIEMTYIFHNFNVRDDIDFGHLNTPWGSTRFSSLPYFYVNAPDGELMKYGEFKGSWDDETAGIINLRKTGGWNLNSASEADDAPSLALVFGRDRHFEAEQERAKNGQPYAQFRESDFRYGIYPRPDDWKTRPENSWENWYGQAVLPKLHLKQGHTIWYRFFFVINRKDRAIELATSLVDKVDYGLLTFDAAETPRVPVYVSGGKVVDEGVRCQVSGVSSPDLKPETRNRKSDRAHPAFQLFAHPVPGTMPLFLIENTTTGQQVITTDPYIFVPQEKMNYEVPVGAKWDHYRNAVGYDMRVDKNNSRWKRLLGYGYVKKPASDSCTRLSDTVDDALFPSPTTYHLDLWVEKP
ncbi:MAG: hypothetical protein HN341_03350 [Verrucomicrobia bacterium]|jgi:hypothetical protein|nr:hypothetical protein [Verrucomicrobiota bacterium]